MVEFPEKGGFSTTAMTILLGAGDIIPSRLPEMGTLCRILVLVQRRRAPSYGTKDEPRRPFIERYRYSLEVLCDFKAITLASHIPPDNPLLARAQAIEHALAGVEESRRRDRKTAIGNMLLFSSATLALIGALAAALGQWLIGVGAALAIGAAVGTVLAGFWVACLIVALRAIHLMHDVVRNQFRLPNMLSTLIPRRLN